MPDVENFSSGVDFQFVDAKGTVANNPAQFSVVGNQVAYIAGSGVVVTTLDDDGRVLSQRLFVANSGDASSGHSSYHLPELGDLDVRRDSYGYPINSPIKYDGSSTDLDERSAGDKDAISAAAQGKLKERVRAFTCLAMAPNGRVLAVGETGYQPRILLFSLAPNSSSQPFAAIKEHSFGVNHIAFAPDSKSFCSLGSISDGFLHVWRFSASAVALKAGNKCSSLINELLWVDTNHPQGSIVTLGLRFLKVWQYEPSDSASKSLLKGRNILLGRFLDTNFQNAYELGEDQLLLKAEQDFFVLKLRHEARLCPATIEVVELRGIVTDPSTGTLWHFDSNNESHTLPFDNIIVEEAVQPSSALSSPSKRNSSPSKPTQGLLGLSLSPRIADGSIIKALNFRDNIIYLTDDARLVYHNKNSGESSPIVSPPISNLSGGKKCGSEFILFSKTGEVRALDINGQSTLVTNHEVLQVEGMANELTAVEKSGSLLILGDKFGSLTILQLGTDSQEVELQMKAHSSSVNDIVHFTLEDVPVVCSISRDRMIQLFYKTEGKWDLFGTIPIHTGNLLTAKYSSPYLFVCSADRTVSVHELTKSESGSLDIFQKKIISLKNTPLALDISDSDLVISCNDRSLFVFDKLSLQPKKLLKVHDDKTHQALCLERLAFISSEVMAAYSSDKSLRVFNLLSGKLLGCSWGHMETVIGLYYSENKLMSLGTDGCLFTWKLVPASEDQAVSAHNSPKTMLPEPEISPLLSKINRKILPTNAMGVAQTLPKRVSVPPPDLPVSEPESPTPRLTNATLKRLEAKRNNELKSANSRASTPTKNNGSPSRQTSPSKTSSLMRDTLSPSRSMSPIRNSSFSRKAVGTRNGVKPETSTLLPPPTTNSDAMERCTAYIAMIKSFVEKGMLSDDNKASLKTDVEDLQSLLGHKSQSSDLLEQYSDKLVKLVEEKLAMK